MNDDICVGPAGGCPLCYYNPCRCHETETERRVRELKDKRLKAHATVVELLDCEGCGQHGVVPDDVERAYVCLKCGVTQKPKWISPESGWKVAEER